MSRKEIEIPLNIDSKIIALSTRAESSYSFESLIKHEAFKNYRGPIITTDFVIIPGNGVRKEPILAGDTLVGFKFTGKIDGQERTVISIDHHDSDPRMQRAVSSANLAVAYVNAFGQNQEYPVPTSNNPMKVAVSHYDCDSVSAAAILSGIVDRQYWSQLETAVIAADHTGEENLIADTLQGLDDMMGIAQVKRDKEGALDPASSNYILNSEGSNYLNPSDPIQMKSFEYPLQALNALLIGGGENQLPQGAKLALEKRRDERARAQKFIIEAQIDPEGKVWEENENQEIEEVGQLSHLDNGVYYITIRDGKYKKREKIDTALLPGLLPDAIAIVETSPLKRDRSRWEVAYRAGMRGMALPGFNFHNLPLEELNLGGRWNAGTSGRKGGHANAEAAAQVAQYIAKNAWQLIPPIHLDPDSPYDVESLYEAIFQKAELTLILDQGEIKRYGKVAVVDVFYDTKSGKKYKLREKRHRLKDPKTQDHKEVLRQLLNGDESSVITAPDRPTHNSISERLKLTGESPEGATIRALHEEIFDEALDDLGVQNYPDLDNIIRDNISFGKSERTERGPIAFGNSYKGMASIYDSYPSCITFTPDMHVPIQLVNGVPQALYSFEEGKYLNLYEWDELVSGFTQPV